MIEAQTPSIVEIVTKERILDTFFKVDKVTVSHERFDGQMSEPRPLLVLDRGDAVAALLYDPERRKVIAVNQFRLPTFGKGDGWLIEAVAGMITWNKDGTHAETPDECLRREVEEETGYRLGDFKQLCTYFPSGGGCSERIFLYYAEVTFSHKTTEGGGLADEGEDIAQVEYDLDDFFGKLDAGYFEDGKLIAAGYWLMAQHARSHAAA